MSKKNLNIEAVANEISGGSLFFQKQNDEKKEVVKKEATLLKNPPTARNNLSKPIKKQKDIKSKQAENVRVRPSVDTYARTPVRKRTITRYSFEFFQDQLETLKKFSLEEQMRGERGSMSQMVREAVDAYISKRNNAS
jgi:hypothetical protein